MSDQDPFKKEDEPVTPVTSNDNPFADKLTQITNESGEPKYKDVETALDALKASQEHIRKIEEDNKLLKAEKEKTEAELLKLGSIDDFVNKITPNAQPTPAQETPKLEDALSEEKVAELLQKTLTAEKQKEQQASNLNKVAAAINEAHGDQAKAFVSQRAKELNTTTQELQELAKSNPAVALTLLNVEVKTPQNPAPSLTVTNSNTQKPKDDLPKPARSVTQGGMTNKELGAYWKEVAEHTNKKLGVES